MALMHREKLLQLLARHTPADAREHESLERMVAFVRGHADCFERSLTIGHITGSGWLISAYGSRALLTHHRKLNMWLQLGGHADGDSDVLAVALREAREESGLQRIEPVSTDIFDVDVHPIPARKSEPEHFHYDVRFLLRSAGCDEVIVSDESHELRWVTPEELEALDVDDSVRRMAKKWMGLESEPRARASGP